MLGLSYALSPGSLGVLGEIAAPPPVGDGQITGPSGFDEPQFDDNLDLASCTLPAGSVTFYAASWISANGAPTATTSGFTGAAETFSQAVTEGENEFAFAFSNTATDRISYYAKLSDDSLTNVVTEVNTWPTDVTPTSLSSGGQSAYNGTNAISIPEFTLASPTNIVMIFGGQGTGYDQVTAGAIGAQSFTPISGGALANGDCGIVIFSGTLPAGTYNTFTPTGYPDPFSGVRVEILDVQDATIVGSLFSRTDNLEVAETYDLTLPAVAAGDGIIMGIGTRRTFGDNVNFFSPVGGDEVVDSGPPGSSASSAGGNLFIVETTATASGSLNIGGTNDQPNGSSAAGVAIQLRRP